jgi:hypothetical protein
LAALACCGWLGIALAGSPEAPGAGTVGSWAGSPGLGTISLDRQSRTFAVPGRVIKREQPLEYLAVKKDGFKAYEAVLELDTTAVEFNLACMLIGLSPENAVLPEYHFDPRPVVGDPVEVFIQWGDGESTKALRAEEIFLVDGERVPQSEWIYTGSTMTPDGVYLAEAAGTLVGFVHDKDSIIEHRTGIGLGNFGAVVVDETLLPPEGSPIRLVVRNPAGAGKTE